VKRKEKIVKKYLWYAVAGIVAIIVDRKTGIVTSLLAKIGL